MIYLYYLHACAIYQYYKLYLLRKKKTQKISIYPQDFWNSDQSLMHCSNNIELCQISACHNCQYSRKGQATLYCKTYIILQKSILKHIIHLWIDLQSTYMHYIYYNIIGFIFALDFDPQINYYLITIACLTPERYFS